MADRSKQTFVYLWIFALLGASVGLSIHRVYCYCVGEATVSFFAAEDACQLGNNAEPIADCCKKTAASAKKSCCEKPDPDAHGCTRKTTQVFQLKTDFENNHFEFKKLAAPKSCTYALIPAVYPSALFPVAKSLPLLFERPPPRSGRSVCLRHGVFRC